MTLMQNVALLLDVDYEFSLNVLHGVHNYARSEPLWQIVPIPSSDDAILYRLLRERRLSGIIGSFMSDKWIDGLPLNGRPPIVNISDSSHLVSVPSVINDNYAIGRLAAEHLIRSGYKNFAVISGRSSMAASERVVGFMETVRMKGCDAAEPPPSYGYAIDAGWDAWLIKLPRPCGIFLASDYFAARVVAHINDAGMSVPGDFGLVGSGDAASRTALLPVPLSTVILSGVKIGERAARSLSEMIRLNTVHAASQRVPPAGLIQRISTQLSTTGDPLIGKALAVMSAVLDRPLSTDELARLCGVSRRSLEIRFVKILGRGPAAEHRRRRLAHAELLLENTEMTQEEIAEHTGFGDAGHFSAVYKKIFGKTPGQHRKEKTEK